MSEIIDGKLPEGGEKGVSENTQHPEVTKSSKDFLDRVEGVVGAEEEEELSPKVIELLTHLQGFSFFQLREDGMYINTAFLREREDFLFFLDRIFNNKKEKEESEEVDFYIKGLEYDTIQQLLLDFDGVKKSGKSLLIGKSLREMTPNRIEKYPEPKTFSEGKMQIDPRKTPINKRDLKSEYIMFSFRKVYDHLDDGEGGTIEIQSELNIDEFIARMWVYGIKFGLKYDLIDEEIKKAKDATNPTYSSGDKIVAEPLKPKHGEDACLIAEADLDEDPSVWINALGDGVMTQTTRTIVEIAKDTILFKARKSTRGTPGMSIYGEIISPNGGNNIKFEEVCSNSVRFEERNGVGIITSNVSGFFADLNGCDVSENGKLRIYATNLNGQKIEIKPEKEVPTIGSKSGGSIRHAPGKVTIKADYRLEVDDILQAIMKGYYVNAESLESNEGEINGAIDCEKDIEITGNVNGAFNSSSSVLTGNKDDNKIDGQIYSRGGKITITGKVNKAQLRSLKKSVEVIGRIEESQVFGREIKVQSARNTTFIGENIIAEGVCENCTFIFTNSISAKQFQSSQKGTGNKIIVISPEDFDKEIEEINNDLNQIKEQIKILRLLLIIAKKGKPLEITQDDLDFLSSIGEDEKNKILLGLKYKKISIPKKGLGDLNIQKEELEKQIQELENQKATISLPQVLINMNIGSIGVYLFDSHRDIKKLTDNSLQELIDFSSKVQGGTQITTIKTGSEIYWQYSPVNKDIKQNP